MITRTGAFSGFSVDSLDSAVAFYRDTLGLPVTATPVGLQLDVTGGAPVFVYSKGAGHEPASYTVLNLTVPDIDQAVSELAAAGIELLRYPGMDWQGEDGVARAESPDDGPTIAWISDPAGNVIGIIEDPA